MLLALIMLTQLDGNPVWIESSAIVIVKQSHTGLKPERQCATNAGAAIRVGSLGLCVKETPELIRKKIDENRR